MTQKRSFYNVGMKASGYVATNSKGNDYMVVKIAGKTTLLVS